MLHKITALLVVLLGAFPAYSAEITTSPPADGSKYQYIYVRDVIVGGDDKKLEEALKEAEASGNHAVVDLESRGGDVDVSMAMGRSIRNHKAVTYHRKCASSCVFAFLGGVQRYTVVRDDRAALIVHRPELGEIYVSHPTAYGEKMLRMLRDYIVEMVGKAELFDVMMTISFNSPRALSRREEISTNTLTKNK
jgi:hypothetical protein